MTIIQHAAFSYTLIRSRRKTLAIIVNARGELTVRAPLRVSLVVIADFVQSRQAWVLEKLALVARRAAAVPVHRFAAGEQFPYQGQYYPLEITPRARPALDLANGVFCLAAGAQQRAGQVFATWYRARATVLVLARLDHFTRGSAFTYQKLRITSARTRWGSCARRGTLSFSWRVAALPPDLLDYVVVHELCHLLQPNHGPAFWAEVERILPDMRARRKALSAWASQVAWD